MTNEETPNQFVKRVLRDAKEHKKQEEQNIGNWNRECLHQITRNPNARKNSSRT